MDATGLSRKPCPLNKYRHWLGGISAHPLIGWHQQGALCWHRINLPYGRIVRFKHTLQTNMLINIMKYYIYSTQMYAKVTPSVKRQKRCYRLGRLWMLGKCGKSSRVAHEKKKSRLLLCTPFTNRDGGSTS
ncbi:hypothetical protein TNIN_282401 [Trichonephila inaurata madagascariensis]|uniref:Uncharacterized protein n=1 Tax=Trichonephila inaurata madagascariensis TaxID=2747483 RepID=A0A8X7CRM8_9ARAC|nr:hypothetical protein TNIN_282401 [Trichonephila inaurata madagascariensis]